MPVQNPISSLFKRLREAGINTAFVKSAILPEWWKDDIAQNPAEYASVLSMISQASGISLEILYDDDAEIPKPSNKYDVKFKESTNIQNTDIIWAAEFGRFISRVIFRALPQITKQEQARFYAQSASDIRRNILHSHQTVDLEALLKYCFSCGIPIVHLAKAKISPKPHGMATSINGSMAIVLFANHKHPSRLAFDIAHELGHITIGHLEQKQTIIDECIEGTSNDDPHEEEANEFANKLLMGEVSEVTAGYNLSAEKLAQIAKIHSANLRIEPGTIALNYAHHKNFIKVGIAALNILEPNTDAPRVINETLLKNLALDELSYEMQDRLLRALGFAEYPDFLNTANTHE